MKIAAKTAAVCLLLGFLSFSHAKNYEKIDWQPFADFEPWKNSKVPDKVKALNNKAVQIPGFMMPLVVDKGITKEFLFVPGLPACAHVPPAPPNMTILVKAKDSLKVKATENPLWLKGKLKLLTPSSGPPKEGDALYELEAESVEDYQ